MSSGRSEKSQSKHDAKVARVADGYKGQGWKVQADLPGETRPKTILGYRPDVVARKGGETRVIEVETPDSLRSLRDRQQQKAFREWARAGDSRTFRRTVAR